MEYTHSDKEGLEDGTKSEEGAQNWYEGLGYLGYAGVCKARVN